MGKSGFYRFGQFVGVKYNRARWMWNSVAGGEEDSIRAEQAVGRDMARIVCEQSAACADASVQAVLDELSRRLARSVRNRLHHFEVRAVSDETPTAFALPGGFIFVADTLVELCGRNGDELAFVVGHEMAHVIRRHAIERLLSQRVLSAAAYASPGRGVLGPWIRKVGLEWLERAYTRENEFEADELGARLAQASGFDLAGAIRLLRRLGAWSEASGGRTSTYLATHPPVTERVAHLRERLGMASDS